MAIFDDEYKAVSCAYELIKAVYSINKKHGSELFIGIGINYGEVIAGNIGSRNRLEYAVIGDTVNLASRLFFINNHDGTYSVTLSLNDDKHSIIKDPTNNYLYFDFLCTAYSGENITDYFYYQYYLIETTLPGNIIVGPGFVEKIILCRMKFLF